MTQPRRRRRKRRKNGGGGGQAQGRQQQAEPQSERPRAQSRSRRRGSQRRRGAQQSEPASPKSSEDLVRAQDRRRPKTITAAPDGQTLEQVIGDLQSVWGVPQYPQEYRITLKVADEKEARAERAAPVEEVPVAKAKEAQPAIESGRPPRREKAPAAPRVTAVGEGGPQRERAGGRRRRSRRRRRKTEDG